MPELKVRHFATPTESAQAFTILKVNPNGKIKIQHLTGRDGTTTQKFIFFSYKAFDGKTYLIYGAQQAAETSTGVMLPLQPILNASEVYCTINDPLLADLCEMWLTFDYVDEHGNIVKVPPL